MPAITELESRLLSSNTQVVKSAIKDVKDYPTSAHKNLLIHAFSVTTVPRARDLIAIALSDLQVVEGIPLIIAEIEGGRTAGQEGSLVYALENYQATPAVLAILINNVTKVAKWICTRDWETRDSALGLLRTVGNALTKEGINEATLLLESQLSRFEEKYPDDNSSISDDDLHHIRHLEEALAILASLR
jgi:hypothetical protein